MKGEVQDHPLSDGKARIDRALIYVDDKLAMLEKDPAGFVVHYGGKVIPVEGGPSVDFDEIDETAFMSSSTAAEIHSAEARFAEIMFESGVGLVS